MLWALSTSLVSDPEAFGITALIGEIDLDPQINVLSLICRP